MTVSINASYNFAKRKAFDLHSTREHFNIHHIVMPSFMVTFLIAACIMFMLSALVHVGSSNDINNVFAQGQQADKSQDSDQKSVTSSSSASKDEVTIDLTSVEFAPLTSSENNQLKIIFNYKTNDPSLINTPMAGTMKVFDSNGNTIKTSKIGNGYVLGQSGPMQFATTLTDKTISEVKAEAYLTDNMGNKISNTLTTNASLSK